MTKRKHREDFHDDFSYERYIDELFEGSYKNGYDVGKVYGYAKARSDVQVILAKHRKEKEGTQTGRVYSTSSNIKELEKKIVRKGGIEP